MRKTDIVSAAMANWEFLSVENGKRTVAMIDCRKEKQTVSRGEQKHEEACED